MQQNIREKPTFIYLLVFASVLSQMPMFVGVSTYRYFYYGLWIIAIIGAFMKTGFDSRFHGMLILVVLYDFLMICGYFINGGGYISSGLFTPINMCAVICFCGCSYGIRYRSDEILLLMGKAYFWASAFVAAQIYLQFLQGVNYADATTGTLYVTKNSAATVILTAVIAEKLIIEDELEGKIFKLLVYNFVVILFSICIFMLKSRTNILCLLVFLLIYIFVKVKSPFYKIVLLAALIAGTVYVLTNETAHTVIIDNILLNGKSISDIYGVTSGRNNHLEIFKTYFPKSWLMGYGDWYLESMPLTTLISYGVIGAIPVFLLALYPFRCLVKYHFFVDDNRLSILLFTLAAIYLVNGIFEEQPPFGPGVKCFFLWFTTGIYLGKLGEPGYERNFE